MRLAADANVLLAAVLGGRAGVILHHPEVEEVFTTAFTVSEVEEYALLLARKKRISLDALHLTLATLPVSLVSRETYLGQIPRARALIAHRDPDDVELLALALHLEVPIWSNDSDFEGISVEWYTTAQLLHRLELSSGR